MGLDIKGQAAEAPDRWPYVIIGLGVLFGLVLIGELIAILTLGVPRPSGFRIGMVTSSPFIGGTIYGGYWLAQSDLPTERYPRIGGWCLASLVVFTTLVVLITLRSEPLTILQQLGAVRWAGSIGAALGVLIGVFEARAIERAREADRAHRQRDSVRRERDRLEEFASTVSHDLRNPLNVATGHLELARTNGETPHLDEVAASLDRMSSIIEETLALAREGRTVSETTAVDLAALAEHCWRGVETSSAKLVVEQGGSIEADRDRLQHVFENLYRNAIEYGGETVTVRVGILSEGDGFYIEDDGPGIPETARNDVFELGHTTGSEGSGFGLAIVQNIVEAHGWTICVIESEAGGARFEITGVERVLEQHC